MRRSDHNCEWRTSPCQEPCCFTLEDGITRESVENAKIRGYLERGRSGTILSGNLIALDPRFTLIVCDDLSNVDCSCRWNSPPDPRTAPFRAWQRAASQAKPSARPSSPRASSSSSQPIPHRHFPPLVCPQDLFWIWKVPKGFTLVLRML